MLEISIGYEFEFFSDPKTITMTRSRPEPEIYLKRIPDPPRDFWGLRRITYIFWHYTFVHLNYLNYIELKDSDVILLKLNNFIEIHTAEEEFYILTLDFFSWIR